MDWVLYENWHTESTIQTNGLRRVMSLRARTKVPIECINRQSTVIVVVYFTLLTDPLRFQPWSQDRRNQIKPDREHGRRKKHMESRQKETDMNVACKGHRRQEGAQKRQKVKKKQRQKQERWKHKTSTKHA